VYGLKEVRESGPLHTAQGCSRQGVLLDAHALPTEPEELGFPTSPAPDGPIRPLPARPSTNEKGPPAQVLDGPTESWSGKRGSNPRPSAWEGVGDARSDAILRLLRCDGARGAARSGVLCVAPSLSVADPRPIEGLPGTPSSPTDTLPNR
jgi:hypothetical protein